MHDNVQKVTLFLVTSGFQDVVSTYCFWSFLWQLRSVSIVPVESNASFYFVPLPCSRFWQKVVSPMSGWWIWWRHYWNATNSGEKSGKILLLQQIIYSYHRYIQYIILSHTNLMIESIWRLNLSRVSFSFALANLLWWSTSLSTKDCLCFTSRSIPCCVASRSSSGVMRR